jgi:hypothetical protein
LTSLTNLTKTGRTIARNSYRLIQRILHRQRIGISNIFSQIGLNISGQIATLLTLLMVIILVLILIVINVGDISLKATALSNAADAGALQLASQLGTRSKMLKDSLGGYDKCQKGGLLNTILAVVLAVVAVVVAIVSFGVGAPLALMAIGAVAGAIGGGAGAAISGTSIGKGMLMGAAIGAAIGGGAAALAPAAGGATVTVGAGETALIETAGTTVVAEAGSTVVVAASNVTVTAAGSTVTVAAGAANVTVTAAAGSTVTVAAGAANVSVAAGTGSTVTVAAGAANVSVAAGTGSTVTVAAGATNVSVVAGTGANVTMAAGTGTVTAAGTGSSVVNAMVSAYNTVNSAISFVLSLPGKALGVLANQLGIGSAASSAAGTTLIAGEKALTIGEALSMAASGGASIYQDSVSQQMKTDAANQLAKSLNALSDRDMYREGSFLTVLSQTINDPNKVQDTGDSDGDGDTTEMIPVFQQWWDNRVTALKEENTFIFSDIAAFWQNDVTTYNNYLKTTGIPYLTRQEIGGVDGPIVLFCRALEAFGPAYDLDFWTPGPDQAAMEYWESCDPETDPNCNDQYLVSQGYDGLDIAIDEFASRTEGFDGFLEQDYGTLASIWSSWLDWFYKDVNDPDYNPLEDGSFATTFLKILGGDEQMGFIGMEYWIEEIRDIKDSLPVCQLDPYGVITNLPCKFDGISATIDQVPDDDFEEAISYIDSLKSSGMNFRFVCENLYNAIDDVDLDGFGGLNPVTYEWADSGGDHSIQVQISNFKIPHISEPCKSGNWLSNETCWYLRDYADTDGSTTKVRVTRNDPGEKSMGILGFWRTGRTVRTSAAHWNENNAIGIRRISW